MSREEWIGVDLDGTLAFYEHWVAETHIGRPIPGMVDRVRQWLKDGHRVKVFTARVSADMGGGRGLRDVSHIVKAIQDWTERHIGVRLEVTNVKDYDMLELWDDRAIQVKANTGERVGYSTRGNK